LAQQLDKYLNIANGRYRPYRAILAQLSLGCFPKERSARYTQQRGSLGPIAACLSQRFGNEPTF
jgi:hypothetical protein